MTARGGYNASAIFFARNRAAVVLRFAHELSSRGIAIDLGISAEMAEKYADQATA